MLTTSLVTNSKPINNNRRTDSRSVEHTLRNLCKQVESRMRVGMTKQQLHQYNTYKHKNLLPPHTNVNMNVNENNTDNVDGVDSVDSYTYSLSNT